MLVIIFRAVASNARSLLRSHSSPPPSFTKSPFSPRDGQTSPHRHRLVVSRSTCPPVSPSPHANSFVIGTAVINNNFFIFIFLKLKHSYRPPSQCHHQQDHSHKPAIPKPTPWPCPGPGSDKTQSASLDQINPHAHAFLCTPRQKRVPAPLLWIPPARRARR